MNDRPKYERHSRAPLEFTVAFERGDLSMDAYALGHWMTARADYSHETGATFASTFAGLAERFAWGVDRRGKERAGRAARELKAGGWVEFDAVQGKRRPLNFRLTGLLLRERGADIRRTSRSDLGQFAEVDQGAPEVEQRATPLDEKGNEPTGAADGGSRAEVPQTTSTSRTTPFDPTSTLGAKVGEDFEWGAVDEQPPYTDDLPAVAEFDSNGAGEGQIAPLASWVEDAA